jgi:hypothetical protein
MQDVKLPWDIEDVETKLLVTVSLVEMLTDSYLKHNTEHVCTKTALDVLMKENFNGGMTGPTYTVVRTYGLISDCAVIIQDRLEDILVILREIVRRNLKERTVTPA